MVRYRPPAYRPAMARGSSMRLGQARLPEKVLVTTAVATVVFAGLGILVGINTGQKEEGLLSVAGWSVAVGSGLFAGFQLASLLAALTRGGAPSGIPGRPI